MLHPRNRHFIFRVGILAFLFLPFALKAGEDWPFVGGDEGASRFSALKQINRKNVKKLQRIWTFHTGDSSGGSTIECTPIKIGGRLYLTTAASKAVSLDAATGEQIWKFDPYSHSGTGQPRASGGVNRGLAYWKSGAQERILFGVADGRLISLDAKTGIPDPDFGTAGVVDLRAGMPEDLRGVNYGPTSAPAVFRNIVVLGFSCPEGGKPAPGDPRAFDIRSGKEVWRFHSIPRPGEFGNETWQTNSWKLAGAANNWGGTTIDTKRGLVFIATGSASPDFYGGGRKGNNLFADCTICLDALTGKRQWHFQTIHHDLWDHDLPVYPTLVTVEQNGKKKDAVAQVTKTGYVFLFDRVTGVPLFAVEERPVPASDVPGEEASSTQPIPGKPPPFSRQNVTESDLTDITPESHEEVLRRFRKYRSGAQFLTPSVQGTVVMPGFHGGANWSGASFDPSSGILYVNANNQPNITRLVQEDDEGMEKYHHTGYFRFLDKDGYPAIKPPWGVLNAIDLNRGVIVWQVCLGEFPELKARGVPQTGTENFGGTIVTAGGLVFIGGTKDEKFHAFDKETGKLLWETPLDAGGYATPCTYAVKGRQYVVIAAGGGGKLGTRSGDAFHAFALAEH